MQLSRRQFLRQATVGGGLLVASGGALGLAGDRAVAQEESGGEGRFAAQVDAGLAYFRRRAAEQVPLVETLVAAIESRDLGWARSAYVEARPPYEEIEVLAASFEQTDFDIDARPYSFDDGESSEDFRGFHRVESLIYRDCDLKAALPYARGLVESARELEEDLRRRESFDAVSHFEGMIGLATEVPARKISSEEETYSDQSLLIFYQNWRGIYNQFDPFVEEVEARDPGAAAEVTNAYVAARAMLEPHFVPGRVDGTPYSLVGISERKRIVDAGHRYRDALIRAAEALELV